MTDSPANFVDLAEAWWVNDGASQAWDDVDEIVEHRIESVPELIRALVATAPDGALSYIGVCILEDLSIHDSRSAAPQHALDVLLAANLEPAVAYEILAGPYPEYLETWRVRERLGELFTPQQLDALYDWPGRSGQRLAMEGSGFRLLPPSSWFDTTS